MFRRQAGSDAIRYSGLDYAIDVGLKPATAKRNYRILLIIMLVLVIGLIWSAPELRTSRPLLFGPAEKLNPVYLLALDASGSMTEPLGGYVIDGSLNLDGPTKFDASQAELYGYAEQFPDANLGLILFSIQPMLVRWPTSQSEFDFHDIPDEGMRFTNPGRVRTSQLARFAGGTATRAGLAMARYTLSKQRTSYRALILIGDLIDNIDEVIEGVQLMEDDGVYIYVVALDALPESLVAFTSMFQDKPYINIYPVTSTTELSAAITQIKTIESDRQVQSGSLNYVQDIRWLVCLIGFIVGVTMIILFETRLHKTHR